MSVDFAESDSPRRFTLANTGRISKCSPELIEKICDLLANGEPLAKICRLPGMPKMQTVFDWERDIPGVSVAIAQAREHGYDAIAARLRPTARGLTLELGGESTGDVQRDKLIIETDLKLLAKWSPRYAEKRLLEHSGEVNVQHSTLDPRLLNTEQREVIRQLLDQIASDEAQPVIEGEAFAPDDYA